MNETQTKPSAGAVIAADLICRSLERIGSIAGGNIAPASRVCMEQGIAEIIDRETGAAKLADALKDVMLWIDNWNPPFIDDPEWDSTEAAVRAALDTWKEMNL